MPSKPSKPDNPRPRPTAKLAIDQYMHCKKCLTELVAIVKRTGQGQSPAMYSRYDVGFTKEGLQIWCRRHEINIAHIDFEGQRHPANLAGEDPTPPTQETPS